MYITAKMALAYEEEEEEEEEEEKLYLES